MENYINAKIEDKKVIDGVLKAAEDRLIEEAIDEAFVEFKIKEVKGCMLEILGHTAKVEQILKEIEDTIAKGRINGN